MANDQSSCNPGPTNQKRKRLDARDYKRQWQVFTTKKHKQKGESESTPEIKVGNLSSDNIRDNNEVKSQPEDVNAAAALEQSATSVPKGCEQASLSTDAPLPEITHGEKIEDGVIGAKAGCELSTEAPLPEMTHGEKIEDEIIGAKDSSEIPVDCMTKSPRYIEYWVPVALSYVQLEKYCEMLLKSSMVLCASVKSEIIDSVHEILIAVRKCCDHPYLVDSTLQEFVNRGRSVGDYLSNGIEVSGKLLVLGNLLEEIRRKHLRVLIVFQSNDSKSQSINLQHFLDDLVLAKVGKGCYVHIFREFDSSQRRAAVDVFNDKESGKLVMLIEKSSCQANIKLSSMDCVILFNSDLSPNNDLKSLRRMTIQSKLGHVKVFRLYSSCTVEEKALTLAKEGPALESSLNNINYNACHMLLLWGASDLFIKLDEFHSHCSSIADLKCLSDDKLALDVVKEISEVLSSEENDVSSCLLVSKVQTADAENAVLLGKKAEPPRDDDLQPYEKWFSVLDGKNPLWKLLPGSSHSTRRRGRLSISPAQFAEDCNSGAKMMSKKTLHSINEFLFSKPRSRKAEGKAAGKGAVPSKSHGYGGDDSWGPGKIDEICMQRLRELILKQKKEIQEFYSNKRKARETLEEEHRSEVNSMNTRCKEPSINKLQLKNLDLIYKQKFEEHNRKMDTKRQYMEAEHLALRNNEKQLKDKLFALLKTEDYLLMKSLLETPLGQQFVGLTDKSSCSGIMRSAFAPPLESEGSQEIEHCTTNASVQQDDLESLPDEVLQDTEILSMESEDRNVGISMLREEVCDTADCDIKAPGDLHCEDDMRDVTNSSTSATLVCKLRIEEFGHSDCNSKAHTGPCNEDTEMGSATDSGDQHMIKEYNIGDHSGASTGVAEMRDDTVLGTFATLAVQERIKEQHDGDCKLEAHVTASNNHAETSGTGDAVREHSVEKAQNGAALLGPSNAEAEGGGVADLGVSNNHETRGAGGAGPTSMFREHSVEKAQNGAALLWPSNADAERGGITDLRVPNNHAETRGASDAGPTSMFREHSVEKAQNGAALLGASNAEAAWGGVTDSLPVISSNIPCHEIRATTVTSGLMNSQTSRVLTPCQPGYTHEALSNIGLGHQPFVQSILQSSAGQTHPHTSLNSVANSDFQESSLRYNQISSTLTDPLQFEVERIHKELEELVKVFEDKDKLFDYNHTKEIQEIDNKYHLLRRESKNERVRKELELKSFCQKVEANKLLAEAFKSMVQKQISSSVSQEDLCGTILQMNPMQLNLCTSRTSVVRTTPPQLPPQQPVQVRELSELITFNSSRPQKWSPLTNSFGYQAHYPAPHLQSSMRSVSPSVSNTLTSFDGLMNQQHGVWAHQSRPSLYQMGVVPRFPPQLGGTPQNPPLL